MVRIYYNPEKKVFVAEKLDGVPIKVSKDFSVVDVAAHKISAHVKYEIDSFPKEIRLKIAGKEKLAEKDGYKFLFMKLVFSFKKICPPDNQIRKIVRTMLKHNLRLVEILEDNKSVYVITYSKTYGFVVFRSKENVYGWSTKTVHKKRLPDFVRKRIEELEKSIKEVVE